MKKLWDEHGAFKRDGEQAIKTKSGVVNAYSDSGANKGWLLPMTVDQAAREDKRAKESAAEKAKEAAAHKKKTERMTAISADVRAGTARKKVSDANVRRQVMSVISKEFKKANGGASGFPADLWNAAFDEAEGLRGGT